MSHATHCLPAFAVLVPLLVAVRRLAVLLSLLLFVCAAPALAQSLSVTPITWDVIGLDSNDVTKGPNEYPVGARVCNIGASTLSNVGASIQKVGTSNSLVNFTGATSLSIASLPSGSAPLDPSKLSATPSNCYDFYFWVTITRSSAAYSTAQPYKIDVTVNGSVVASTPTNRQLYVEKFISQGRNSSDSFTGPLTVVVGGTYNYTFIGKTATQGYPQLTAFPNLPNTIFQIVGVSAKYDAPTGAINSTVYADACGWVNDYTDPNYLKQSQQDNCSLTDDYTGGKVGDGITVVYTVKILAITNGGPSGITNVVTDFSGSSYHYVNDTNPAYVLAVNAYNPPDLTVTKTANGTGPTVAGKATFIVNQPATYTLTVSNLNSGSSDTARGTVKVTDTLPSGMTYGGASGTNWSCDASLNASRQFTCTYTGASLTVGSSAPAITVNVTPTVTGDVTNTATVVHNDPTSTNPTQNLDADTTNNTTSVTNTVGHVDLTITKTHGSFTPGSGSYTLTVTNGGTLGTAGTITVTDVLPGGLTLSGGTASAGWTCTGTTTVTCTTGNSVAAGGQLAVTFAVAVPGSLGANLVNTATVSGGSETPGYTGNNTSGTDTVNVADLSVAKSANVSGAVQNDEVTYTVRVTNNGHSAASSVVVEDVLPSGVTHVESSATVGTYVVATGQWTVGSLASGATATLTIKVRITATSGTVTNAAQLKSVGSGTFDPDSTPGNGTGNGEDDTASVGVTVGAADVMVTKTGPVAAVAASNATYTLVVRNNGPVAASGVVLKDTLPVGVTLVAASSTAGYTQSGNELTWTVGAMNLNEERTFTVVVKLPTGTATKTFVNTATVTSGATDSQPGNNTSTATTKLAAMQLVKVVRNVTQDFPAPSGTPAVTQYSRSDGSSGHPLVPMQPGDVLEYCLNFENVGAAVLGGVVLNDPIPGRLTGQPGTITTAYGYTPSPTPSGTVTASALSFALGTVNPGESGRVCFRATVN